MNDVRAVAAIALDRIARAGISLRVAFAEAAPTLPDPRDRALLSALLHAGSRGWLRYEAALARLLARPLTRREPVLQALLVLGLVQIATLGLPEYAAVAATVEATRRLRRPAFANLVNAVLRRYLRERTAIESALDTVPCSRWSLPRWMIDMFSADWGSGAPELFAASNTEAPFTVRVNARRTSVAGLLGRWRQAGVAAVPHTWLPQALVLAESCDVTRLPGYADGEFSVQDGAAQLAAPLLDLRAGQRVLDACAAPGGKSAHILETADVDLLALDADAARLDRTRDNLSRLGLNARLCIGDATTPVAWWDGRPFERILLDAPCTATGILRRQPDVRLHRRPNDVAALCAQQARLLDELWPLLAVQGRLVYATCSVLKTENAIQVGAFLARTPDAVAGDVVPSAFGCAAGAGRQNLTGTSGMDGFFYAVMEKSA